MILRNFSPYIWLSAFLCSLFFINAWQLELIGASIMLVFIWAIVMLPQRAGWKIPKSWVLRIMGLFWLLVFLSVLRSDILNVSLMAFCFFSVMPLSFLVFAVQGEERDYKIIAIILAFIFAGLSIWALLQFFVYSDYFEGRARHPLANPNSLAALFNLGFFCSVGWMLGAKKKVQSNIALFLSVLIFGGIVATGSRGALLSLLPILIFFLYVMRAQALQHWRCLSLLGIGCAALFVLSSFGAAENDNLIVRISDTLTLQLADVSSNRLNLWKASAAMIKAHGLFGTGIGTYFLYFPEFRLTEDQWGAFYAHSDPLQYWVELGILGPILFYALMIAVIRRTINACKKTSDVTQRLLILTPFCALGAVILHTHITFNLYNLSILFGVGFLLSVWFWATQNVLQTTTKEVSFPANFSFASRVVAIALPFILIGGLFFAYILGEHYTNKARDHLLANEFEAFANDVVYANQVSFQGTYRAYLLAVNIPLGLLESGSDELSADKRKEIFDQALYYLRQVKAINPRSSSALYYLAKLQQLVPKDLIPEDLKSPEEYYAQALKIDPLHVGARLELAKIYQAEGRPDESLKILEQGVSYKYSTSKVVELYTTLLKVYVETGDEEKRKKIIEKMHGFQMRLKDSEKRKNRKLSEYLWGNN